VRVNRDTEEIFFQDSETLARGIGHLLGCHSFHRFGVNSRMLSLTVALDALGCVQSSRVPFRYTLNDDEPSPYISTPPPPPSPF